MNIFEHLSEIANARSIVFLSREYFIMVGLSLLIVFFFLAWGYLASVPNRRRIFIGMVISVVVLEGVRQLWFVLTNQYQMGWVMPLHLCGLQVFLIPLMTMTNSKFLKNFVFYTAVPGGIGAILFNDITFPFLHWLVFQSYFIHALILCIPIYMILYMDFKPSMKYIFPSAIFLVVIAVPIYFINLRLGSNYLYLNDYVANSPMEIIYDWVGKPGYIFVFFAMFVILWILMTLPFYLKERKHKELILKKKSF